MDATTALLAQLRDLARGASNDGPALAGTLTTLVASLGAAVPSYRSLQLTLTQDGYPVVLTAGDGPRSLPAATTSLRLSLTSIIAGCAAGSRIVFYASAPGAFVDLAADLHHALGSTGPEISLDVDLPPSSHPVGLSGGAELAEINRAIGVLIERGAHPDEAHDTLRIRAASAGLGPHAYALDVLRETGAPGPSA